MRESKSIKPESAHAQATVDASGDTAIVTIKGLVDERFPGFGAVGDVKTVILNVAGITRMSSFGVRQWLKAVDGLPKNVEAYLLGCPTFFVDQLNMVMNFGGAARVLSVMAPFVCAACGAESGELIDVFAERHTLGAGTVAAKECRRCGGKLELDEAPESYFAFVGKYAATHLPAGAQDMLAARALYVSSGVSDTTAEKPPKIIKLVHGAVTYFRIIGTIGTLFRSRPFLVGAEGEIVIDLSEVERFDPKAHGEWKRLLKSLVRQVPSVTLADVTESFLVAAGDTLSIARNLALSSLLVPRKCAECQRTSRESASLEHMGWPLTFEAGVCSMCGGTTVSMLSTETLAPLQKASTQVPPASAKVIAQRAEIISRAVTDAKVAQAGAKAAAAITASDIIFGKYKIVQRLSVGGMAEVFLANQVGIGGFEKPVALKRIQRKLLDSRHMAIDMFLNEAKISGRLMHPNIVQVLDVGEAGGALYLAMEYVHGKDLRAVIKKVKQAERKVPLGEALFIAREVATALHYAYWSTDMNGKRLSVVHRDVSPHNVMLGYDGTVKLLDFGVAMSSVTEHAESVVVGKWHYMSPEATTNQGVVDHRSDLFSLGVILYLLVSGQMPFTDREPKDIVKKIRAGQYTPLHEIAEVPESLSTLVKWLLSPNPDDRPQKGLEVVAQLNEIARQSGVETSGAGVADLLAELYSEEANAPYDEPPLQIKDIRPDDQGGASKSPTSFTPPSSSRLEAIDMSVTFQRSPSRRTSKPFAVPPNPGSRTSKISTQPVKTPPEIVRSTQPVTKGINVGMIVLMIALAAALAAVAYFVLPSR